MSKKKGLFLLLVLLFGNTAQATITWTTKAQMPTGRDGLGIAVVRDTVYCIGGWTAGSPGSATGACEAYDPLTNTWITKAPMPTPRGFLAVCAVSNKIYAVGGWNGSSMYLTTVEEYDPGTDTWQARSNMTVGRCGLGAESVNGKVYAIGGFFTDALEEFDPAANTWATKRTMPQPRGFFASEVMRNRIYTAAGRNNSGNVAPTFEYDPQADTTGGNPWQIKADIPTLRYHPEAGNVNGTMYVCGGLGQTGELGTVEAYDPIANTWITETSMPTPRRELDVGVVGNCLYAIGGWPQSIYNVNEEGQVLVNIKEPTAVIIEPARAFHLKNSPNPFNHLTSITYQTTSTGHILLAIYSTSGALVCKLVEGRTSRGTHRVSWNGIDRKGRRLASGVYFCKLRTSEQSEVIRLTMVR